MSAIHPLSDGQHELTLTNGAMVVSVVIGVTGAEISHAPEVAARQDIKEIVDAVEEGSAYVG